MDEKVNDPNKNESQEDNGNDHEDQKDLDVLEELGIMANETSSSEETSFYEDPDDSFGSCPVCGEDLVYGECLACAKREEVERDFFAEDQREPEDLEYTRWREEMRTKGELNLFGIFSVIVVSVYLIYISFPKVLEVLTSEFILEAFFFNLILLVFGIGALFGALVMARHVIIYGRLFDATFEKEIYSRLEPAFAEVGAVKGDIQELNDRMERMTIHMKRLERETRTAAQVGTVAPNSSGSVRYVFLMILSLGVFFYILRYPENYLPYALGALFLLWWGGITSDFMLWKVNIAWTWAFFAVMIFIPGAILMHVLYGTGFVIGVMGIALSLFSFSYYIWAKYYVEGSMPGILPLLGDDE